MNIFDVLKFWEWETKVSNGVIALCAIAGLVSWKDSRDNLCKIIKIICGWFKKLWNKIKYLLNKIINKLREIIIGKENPELLKELKPLKGNKRAINFLTKINETLYEDEHIISRESILINFTNLYFEFYNRNKDKIKEDYEKDKNENKTCDTLETYVLKKFIEETIACDVK